MVATKVRTKVTVTASAATPRPLDFNVDGVNSSSGLRSFVPKMPKRRSVNRNNNIDIGGRGGGETTNIKGNYAFQQLRTFVRHQSPQRGWWVRTKHERHRILWQMQAHRFLLDGAAAPTTACYGLTKGVAYGRPLRTDRLWL